MSRSCSYLTSRACRMTTWYVAADVPPCKACTSPHQGSVATDVVHHPYSSSTQQYLALGKRCWVFFATLVLIYTTSA